MHPILRIAAIVAFWALALSAQGAQLETLTVAGKTLKGNPLGDPTERRVAVVSPTGVDKTKPLPLIVYLPGWGGSSEDTIGQRNGGWLGEAVDALTAKAHPVRVAVVDGRSRYGGSQFLNSTATGNYADYVAVEVLDAVKAQYASAAPIMVAGHSSGGYGALMLTMARQKTFAAVVALSPDSDFEVTHKPLAQAAEVHAVTPAQLAAAMAPAGKAHVTGGLAGLMMGLCANYVPRAGHLGEFEWLYDAKGQWRADVWKQWLACDPLTAVHDKKDAFAPEQRIYLDGAELDEFGANIGARKIAVVLRGRGAKVEFQEPAGHHAEHLVERFTRGVTWVLEAKP